MATTHRPQRPHRTPPTTADEGWLAQLEADILAEDIEDARREKRRLKLNLPQPPRNLGAYDGFADTGTTPPLNRFPSHGQQCPTCTSSHRYRHHVLP